MLSTKAVDQIVSDTAAATLGGEVVRVSTEPTVDLDGHEALRIMIVLKRGRGNALLRDGVITTTLVDVSNTLLKLGDERFPFIEYATEDELEASDDS